jgi:hypothetical protein
VEGKRIGEDGGGGGGGGRRVLVGGFWRSGCLICGMLVRDEDREREGNLPSVRLVRE